MAFESWKAKARKLKQEVFALYLAALFVMASRFVMRFFAGQRV